MINCIQNLRNFLVIYDYYRRFVKNNTNKSSVVVEKIKKLYGLKKCEEIDKALTLSPVLGHADFRTEFILDTEASFDTI